MPDLLLQVLDNKRLTREGENKTEKWIWRMLILRTSP